MSRSHRRGPWVAEEDATLLSLVASGGPNNWVQISQHMHYRSPKQCRERYHQNLKTSLNHDPISADEGDVIEQMVHEMGKKWAEIARRLGNRSDNAVKNWWNGSQNRRKRIPPHHGLTAKTLTNRRQPLPAVRSSDYFSGQHGRRRAYEKPLARISRPAWDAIENHHQQLHLSPIGELTVDRSPWRHGQTPEPLRDTPERLHQAVPYKRQRESSPPPLRETFFHRSDRIGPSLPPLGPIDTSHISTSYTPHTLQPPISAISMDRAPSLVSDHNSVYSISPKTWSSPRPEIPSSVEMMRSRWPEPARISRRESAPSIPNLMSLPFTGDEGYVSAIPASASSDPKCSLPLPIPMSRPDHSDGRQPPDHQYRSSVSTINLSPVTERSLLPNDSPTTRDTRMNFSSLLN